MTKKERILRAVFENALLWESVKARLERHSVVDIETGCRVWVGYTTSKGYGSLRVALTREDHATILTHRVSWAIANRTVPPSDRLVMHTCDNPPCIEPSHCLLYTSPSPRDS